MQTWGDRRKRIIEIVAALVVVAALAVFVSISVYRPPSCMDGKQNEHETGIDCGGPCPYACTITETPPSVRFARALSPDPGRTDVIAYIDNSNDNAGLEQAQVTVQLYSSNGAVISTKTESVTVPPSTTVPFFIPRFYQGKDTATQVFVTFDVATLKWVRAATKQVTPVPSNIDIQNTNAPRITATLTNPTATELDTLTVVATVFDSASNAIGASQTLVQQLPGQGSVPIVFTWNEPFAETPARVEILPVPTP